MLARGRAKHAPTKVRGNSAGVGATCGRPRACEARLVAEDYAPANSHPFGVGILVRSGSVPPQTEPAGAGLRFGFFVFRWCGVVREA